MFAVSFLDGSDPLPLHLREQTGMWRHLADPATGKSGAYGPKLALRHKVILNSVNYANRDPRLDFTPDPEIVVSGEDEPDRMDAERDKLGRPRL